jgi:TPP-dependent pyruvate/acetoin dehydrogenase alpha subunit
MATTKTLSWKFKPLDPKMDRTEIDPGSLKLSREDLLRLYRAMRMSRTFESRLATLYRQGRLLGAVYLGMGQEAIAAGVVSLLRKDDIFNTVSRSLPAWFYRGVEPKHVLARWLGKDEKPCHGRDLGLFLADLDNFGIAPYHNGSMASWIPSGAGFALAFKMRREPRVYVAFTGDGATSPGDFYEGLNFAAIHKLPLVVIVENNQFGYSTGNERQMPVEHVADRGPAFNIPHEIAFGNCIFTVIEVASRAIEHARFGKGPYLVEFKTFRQRGHGEHDDASYVPKEMREYWEARDPVDLFTHYLLGKGGFSKEQLAAIDAHCEEIMDQAVEYAENLPYPNPETATEGLFAP